MQVTLAFCWHLKAPLKGDLGPDLGPTCQQSDSIDSIKEISNTVNSVVSCSERTTGRRFSCTYDSGDVWCGRVVRLTRDSNGIPLWSGESRL